jgi:hypothetical protein
MKIFPAGIQKTAMPFEMKRIIEEPVSVKFDSTPSSISFIVKAYEPRDGGAAQLKVVFAPTKAIDLSEQENIEPVLAPGMYGDGSGDNTYDVVVDSLQNITKTERKTIQKIKQICNDVLSRVKGFNKDVDSSVENVLDFDFFGEISKLVDNKGREVPKEKEFELDTDWIFSFNPEDKKRFYNGKKMLETSLKSNGYKMDSRLLNLDF